METNENYGVTAGTDLIIDATLRDSDGVAIVGYDGSQALTTVLWPGGNRAASFTATTTWLSPPAAEIEVRMTGAETATLAPGRYQLLTRIADAGALVDAYGCTVDVLGFAGVGAAPKVYTDLNDLMKYGRSWLAQLQTDDDEAGFAEQQARARSWLEDVGHAKFRVASMVMVVGGQGMGPRISGARSVWLQTLFDSDFLMVTDQVRECVSMRALALICEAQLGVGEGSREYARLARMYNSRAEYLLSTMTLMIDSNGDGFGDVTIDCSTCNALYG